MEWEMLPMVMQQDIQETLHQEIFNVVGDRKVEDKERHVKGDPASTPSASLRLVTLKSLRTTRSLRLVTLKSRRTARSGV